MRYDRISILLDQIKDNVQQQGYFSGINGVTGLTIQGTQKGVIRTNCIDCLDRTNVVQSALAKYILVDQLRELQILKPNEGIEPTSSFESVFKNIWADHADAISILYSGTGALKTDFTRTGQRTKMGLVRDGINSAMRYMKNNFMDGSRQDSLDLFLGTYATKSLAPLKGTAATNASTLLVVPERKLALAHYLLILVSFSAVMTFISSVMYGRGFFDLVRLSLMLLFMLTASVTLILNKYGQELVDLPQIVKLDYVAERESALRRSVDKKTN